MTRTLNRLLTALLLPGYEQGVTVLTLAKGGLMYEASVGGQSFSYEPLGSRILS